MYVMRGAEATAKILVEAQPGLKSLLNREGLTAEEVLTLTLTLIDS